MSKKEGKMLETSSLVGRTFNNFIPGTADQKHSDNQ